MRNNAVIFFLLLGSSLFSYGQATTSGKVKFTGEVIAGKLCTVKADSVNKIVPLGTISRAQLPTAGATAGNSEFTLSVTDCGVDVSNANNHRLTYYFVSPAATINPRAGGYDYYLKNTATSPNQNSVGVQVFIKNGTNAGNVLQVTNRALPNTNRDGGGYTGRELGATVTGTGVNADVNIDLSAKFYSVTNGTADKPGQVTSEMNFEVWYE